MSSPTHGLNGPGDDIHLPLPDIRYHSSHNGLSGLSVRITRVQGFVRSLQTALLLWPRVRTDGDLRSAESIAAADQDQRDPQRLGLG